MGCGLEEGASGWPMGIVHFAATQSDLERRARLYAGELFVLPPTDAGRALAQHARVMAEDAFHPLDPRTAQHELPVEQYAAILSELKPAFIHDPQSKRAIQELLAAHGCDAQQTYFDVPRLRTSTSDGYLTTGIAFAFPPHRDTWYSAPGCQLNWWMPIHPLEPDSGLTIFPDHFGRPVANSSEVYDYARWNQTSRFNAARHIGSDTRAQPKPLEAVDPSSELQLLGEVGSVLLFSGAQLHASVPNTSGSTRLSLDFRTVHAEDAKIGRGAENVDSRCTGSSIGDFLRAGDLARLPDDLIARYERGEMR